jgi:4-amino-4-deoxy-L-arabinose transferase-like glycosyltransferase
VSTTVTAPPDTTSNVTAQLLWHRACQACLERTWLRVVLLLAWCGYLFFHGLNAGELWRTESLRAIIAAEFLRSGNWVVPTLYGEPLFTKPPGMYVAIALVSWPLGEVTEWTARLPSALAATVTVLLMAGLFARHLGPRAGLLAGFLTPLSLMWLDKASAAEIDMLQVAWVAGAIVCFLRALEIEEERPWSGGAALAWWLAALVCVAGGVLTKWTAPAFFYGTVLPLLWWRGRWRLVLGWRHLASATLAAGICLAWIAAAVAQTGWETFAFTVQREAFQRIVPNYTPRPYPWHESVLHPLVIFGAASPCSLGAIFALRPGFAGLWDDPGRRLAQAMHCWTWPNLLVWSLMTEHAPRHSFPLLPGIAGLATLVWVAWLTGRMSWPLGRLEPRRFVVGALVVWLIAKLVFVHSVTPERNADREPRAKGELIASLVPRGAVLYLFRLKDEGIMFYYGRPVLRLPSPAQLPSSPEPLYCILELSEWEQWRSSRTADVVERLTDEQGAPIVLVRVAG